MWVLNYHSIFSLLKMGHYLKFFEFNSVIIRAKIGDKFLLIFNEIIATFDIHIILNMWSNLYSLCEKRQKSYIYIYILYVLDLIINRLKIYIF